MQKKLSLVAKRIKSWIKEESITDVVLFGSSVRSKYEPSDVDLCIIIEDSDEEKSLDLVGSLGKLTDKFDFKFHINTLTASSFIKGSSLVKTLLSEGYSIKNGKFLSAVVGFASKSLFVYTLKNFTQSKRVKFHYMLRGRYGSKGILKEVSGVFLGTGSILIPTEKEDLFKEILDRWDVNYKVYRILVS